MSDTKNRYHRFKLKLRRKFRKQKRQVEDITEQADDSLEKLVFRRIDRLVRVKRFVFAWVLLLILVGLGSVWQVRGLDKYYLELAPTEGGVYREGLLGNFTTASPLFATSLADVSVSKLVFSGLFKNSPGGNIEPDLASSYTVDENGYTYTVMLNENARWHDGEPFNADDVVYTYKMIKNPNVKSPLFNAWKDVEVEKIDDYNVKFTLPNTLSSFKYSLTNGIVPEHKLSEIEPENLRTAPFNNIDVVGAGKFKYKSVEVLGNDAENRIEKITLITNDDYYGQNPMIDGIVLRTYRDEDKMLQAFKKGEISSMVGLQTVSDELKDDSTIVNYSTPFTGSVMLFMNNSGELLKEKAVRQALVKATDTDALRQKIGYQLVEVNSPFLKSHFAYDPEKVQIQFDREAAKKQLEEAGWVKGEDGKLYKDGFPMTFRLVSQSLTEYATVIKELQVQWGQLGITIDAVLQPEEDIQSGAISRHDYDILLYGISLGSDPDIFAFWHSSQADERLKNRLNLSEYNNSTADAALEAGRTRNDEELRKIKYKPFLDVWVEDAPAIALYQPRFLFVARDSLNGYSSGQFNDPSDRFYSISNWSVRRDKVIKNND